MKLPSLAPPGSVLAGLSRSFTAFSFILVTSLSLAYHASIPACMVTILQFLSTSSETYFQMSGFDQESQCASDTVPPFDLNRILALLINKTDCDSFYTRKLHETPGAEKPG